MAKKKIEYIPRDDAIRYAQFEGAYKVVMYLEDMKAADVQPVKRGHWLISNIYAKCSCCFCCYDLDTYQRLIPATEHVPRFCVHCGADMRASDKTKG